LKHRGKLTECIGEWENSKDAAKIKRKHRDNDTDKDREEKSLVIMLCFLFRLSSVLAGKSRHRYTKITRALGGQTAPGAVGLLRMGLQPCFPFALTLGFRVAVAQ